MSTPKAATVLIVAGAVVGTALGFGPARRAYRAAVLRRDVARLVDLAARQPAVRSRLSISAAPAPVVLRSGAKAPEPLPLYSAVSTVLGNAARVDAGSSRRALAMAHYCTGDYARAIKALETVVRESPDPGAWSDLAAARLEASRTGDAAVERIAALVAVEQALAEDPGFPPALYNRSAILEAMGLHGPAREAWRVALVAESDPEWRNDIRRRLDAIPARVDSALGPQVIRSLRPDDPAAVREGVDRFPQDARRSAEGVLPVHWAASWVKGDTTAAEEKLRLARALADALHTRSGESLARDAIDAIDEAARTQGAVARLARAYSIYGQGRALLGAYDFAEAEVRLAEASSLFALAKSPMASVARYYEATAILEQNRVDEAAARYGELAMAEDAMGGHRALAADLDWQIARAEGMRGHWDAALHAAQEAVDGYRALGETQNAGFMENMLAELYDYLAQPERSWSHRLVAFALLSEAGYAHPLQVSLGAAARERIRRKDWPAAIALLDLEIAGSQRADQASLRVDALARRARARASNGDTAGARSDVAAARAAAESVKDPNERALVIAGIDVAEGIVEREYDSGRSIGLFTNAIGFYQKASKPILLPEIHLERGRLHLARGEAEKGLADFSRGIDLLEQQRAALSDFDLYSTVSDVGADLYAEAVRLAVSIGDVERAYRFSEHSRGRAIIKWMAATDVAAPARAPQDTRIVELMVLPEKVVVFTVDRTLEMQELDIGRAKLEQLVASFRASIAGDGPSDRARASGAALYDALLRPLGAVSTGVSTLVIVPTGILEGVPWAALYDRESGRYLVENVSVVTAPSATVYTRIGERNAVRSPRALVVGNPKIADDTMGLPVLSGAEREARAISAMYRSPTLLLGADATIPRFEREVKMCDVLHFAGHAVSSETVDDQSFLVLAAGRGPGESGMLYSRDITKLDLRGVSLVVLAACGTIRGPTVHVDGMPSIGRAFIAAGAKAVIGTLWDVDDDRSRALFTRIHRAVSMGVPVGQALRGAQIEAIRSGDPRLAHPNAWGSVTLIGGG